MVRTKDEMLAQIKGIIGDDNMADETLSFLEDFTETFDDLTSRATDTTDWKQKYEENDAAWKKKYRERFFSGSKPEEEDDFDPDPAPAPRKFEDLFKVEGV